MEADSISLEVLQPPLFDFDGTSTGTLELFPAVWRATEELGAPESARRHDALDHLLELNAPRLSPLVAYVLATRITDPDLSFRTRVVQILGGLLLPDREGRAAPDTVRQYLTTFLKQMRTRLVYSLMEVGHSQPEVEEHIARLLNACPHAGRHLVDILADRKAALPVRRQAIHFIGLVGYLDAIPALERLITRLESRLSGQQAMSFAPPVIMDEAELLPVIQSTLKILQAP